MNCYTCDAIRNLIENYVAKGGEVFTLEEGSLGYGLTLLYDFKNKLKTIVIKEVYLNEWSSGHTVRMYNKCPKKYKMLLEMII